MKKRDAVVISAYTGELCCDFKDVQKYVEEVTGKKITKQDYENENIIESLKEYIKPDFVATCDNLSSEEAAAITIHTDTVCCNFDYAQIGCLVNQHGLMILQIRNLLRSSKN